jgi:hypothetical protein
MANRHRGLEQYGNAGREVGDTFFKTDPQPMEASANFSNGQSQRRVETPFQHTVFPKQLRSACFISSETLSVTYSSMKPLRLKNICRRNVVLLLAN